jgi:hypothetical protein
VSTPPPAGHGSATDRAATEPAAADPAAADPAAADPAAADLGDAALRAVPSGSRLENAWLAVLLVLDLLSIPYHVVAFLLTRRRQREAFQRTLEDAAG